MRPNVTRIHAKGRNYTNTVRRITFKYQRKKFDTGKEQKKEKKGNVESRLDKNRTQEMCIMKVKQFKDVMKRMYFYTK